MDYDFFEKADIAVEEAFQAATTMVDSLQLNQELKMNEDYPPAFLINSDELEAQSICVITTHKKGEHLVLRVWSPFVTRRPDADGVRIERKQDYHDFVYDNDDDTKPWNNNNSIKIARLIWNYYSLLVDWHMSYSQNFEGFDLD